MAGVLALFWYRLVLFWTDFPAVLYGNTPFSYVSTVSCAGLAFASLLLPPEEAPA
jgi:hypothetical protein